MRMFSYLRVELKRIFYSKITYLIMILTMLCPIAGYKLYNGGMLDTTVSGRFIGNPSIAGAVGGGIVFAMFTLLEFNMPHKYKIEALTDSIVSPMILNVVRLLAVAAVAIITVSAASIFYYPYTVVKMGNVFDVYTYFNSFFLLMLPSMLFSILAASAFYQIFYRVDLSMLAFILLMLPNLIENIPIGNILHWIKPSVPALSDYFGNTEIFRLMRHNRLFWFLIFGGLWLIGLLCVRSYGKSIFGSVLSNLKKVCIPLMAALLIGAGCYAFINQPDVFLISEAGAINMHNPDNNSNKVSKGLQLSNSNLKISFDEKKGSLSGKAAYSLQNLKKSGQKCSFTINPGYVIKKITVNDRKATFKKLNSLKTNIIFNVPKEKNINLIVEYEGRPKILYFLSDFLMENTISSKYIDLTSSQFLPDIHALESRDNSELTCCLTMPGGITPVVNPSRQDEHGRPEANPTGDSTKLLSSDGNRKTWLIHLNGKNFSLMAGDYVVKQIGNKDMPIEFYYSGKHEHTMKNMDAQKVMKATIEYCTSHYGKLNNVSKTSPLKIVEKTALFPGGEAFPNYSTMGEFCFNDENLNDKSKGASSVETLVHELAHQWWGIQTIGSGGNNKNWSPEGFAVYTTYRVAEKIYGKEYAKKNYVDMWKSRVEENKKNFYTRHPEYLNILPQKYVQDISDNDRTLRLYSKLPLQILKASKLVGGEDRMDEILAQLYKTKSKTKITWQDFLDACGLKEEELKLE